MLLRVLIKMLMITLRPMSLCSLRKSKLKSCRIKMLKKVLILLLTVTFVHPLCSGFGCGIEFSVVFLLASVCKMRLVMECSEADGFHILLVTYEHEEEEYLAPNDLLLLSIEEVHLLL